MLSIGIEDEFKKLKERVGELESAQNLMLEILEETHQVLAGLVVMNPKQQILDARLTAMSRLLDSYRAKLPNTGEANRKN